jgi:flagellar biosynthesis protein FlgN
MASTTITLRDEQHTMSQLLALLKEEQQFLVNADGDALATLTSQKNSLISHMAALAASRHQALGAAGFAAAEDGMAPWLAAQADPSLQADWQQLLAATREAKELNRVNGMLITKQLHQTQTVLQAMRTPASGADAAVYGPSGQTSSVGPSRRFVIG